MKKPTAEWGSGTAASACKEFDNIPHWQQPFGLFMNCCRLFMNDGIYSCREKIDSGSVEACPSSEEADIGVLHQVFTKPFTFSRRGIRSSNSSITGSRVGLQRPATFPCQGVILQPAPLIWMDMLE